MGHQCSPSTSKCPMSPPSYQSPDALALKKPCSFHNSPHNPTPLPTSHNSEFLPCAVCLGHYRHIVIDCKAACTWDSTHKTIAECVNKGLFTKDGCNICGRWQWNEGCPKNHDNRHFCSGCAATTHGSQCCPHAQKSCSADTLQT
ncbi:hypothetical protein PAXRUDRAFT_170388 [Paxillus rubicundulus Ve08.2h10]|uniref:Uncharacterized protein n=1 Tax=Paxillus rubicundulus Ve08.2h10 TaxID=930991 RepID=A0A0D0CYI7_9AGAM|nr:hypothetical protein PAXRUDRAFT_170388 [Paxillus rubicundulus Ve08.2h10]